jgi:hypothetical protein
MIYSQWGMERTIGNLGEEIKQHSNAFANLAQRGIHRCQVNALKAMSPDIEPSENPLPRGAKDLGDSYALLRAMDNISREVRPCKAKAIITYLIYLRLSSVGRLVAVHFQKTFWVGFFFSYTRKCTATGLPMELSPR